MNIHKSESLVLFAVSSFRLCQLEDRVQSEVLSFAHSGPRAHRVNSLRRKEEKSFTMEGNWRRAFLLCAFLVLCAREASGDGDAAEDSVTQLYVKVMNDLKIKYNAGDLEQKLESLN